MTLSEQIAPVLELSRRKRHVVVPEWLQPEAKSDYWWDARLYPKSNERSTHIVIHPDAARLIVTGALAAWCDRNLSNDAWHNIVIEGHDGRGPLINRLIAATLARLDELPDKEPQR